MLQVQSQVVSPNANKLTSPAHLNWQVMSPTITFDGQTGGTTKIFNTAISNTFIANKTLV